MKLLVLLFITINLALKTKATDLIGNPISNAFKFLITNKLEESELSTEDFFSQFESYFSDKVQIYNFHSKNTLYANQDEMVTQYPEIAIDQGVIKGKTLSNAHVFYSIPYALPPVGDLRFKDPIKITESNPYVSDHSKPDYRICYQITENCEKFPCQMTEDCLVLNIHVPATVDLFKAKSLSADKQLPVMVWIHGGFFFHGSGVDPGTDGEKLAASTGAIIVEINYRLGQLGFMAVTDSVGNRYFNQGLKDQQMALSWVQNNIESFGGNKNKVTIFGESAGAQSIMFHMVSEKSGKLFKRGLMQSNPVAFDYQTFEDSIKSMTARTLESLKRQPDDYNYLWEVSAEDLINTRNPVMIKSLLNVELFNGVEPFRPIVDGDEFTNQPLNLFKSGKWNKEKELIVGSNSEEMSYVSAVLADIHFTELLYTFINNLVLGKETTDIIKEMYKDLAVGIRKDYKFALAQQVTDMFFICPSRALARFAAKTSNSKVTLYINDFQLKDPGCSEGFSLHRVCNTSFHSAEIPLVFDSEIGYNMTFSKDDASMVDIFSRYWGSYARYGLENEFEDSPAWPQYVNHEWEYIWLDIPKPSIKSNYRSEYCNTWDETDFYMRPDTFGGNNSNQISASILQTLLFSALYTVFLLC